MRLWFGLLLLLFGGILAVIGYAPLMSTRASSLALIGFGGVLLAMGTFITLIVSAKRMDPRDFDDSWRIRL